MVDGDSKGQLHESCDKVTKDDLIFDHLQDETKNAAVKNHLLKENCDEELS